MLAQYAITLSERETPAPREATDHIVEPDCRIRAHYYGVLRGNISLPVAGLAVSRTAARPGITAVKCDVHGWMQAFVRVDTHDLHAVTDRAGRYRIDSIPAGTYEVEFWHERLGRQRRTVTVLPGRTASLDLSFDLGDEENPVREDLR